MKHVLLVGNLDGHSAPLLRYASKFCKELKLKLHILQIEPNSDPILLSSPYYYNKFGLMMNYNSSEKKEELENFVLKNTKNLIDSTWISCKIIRGNVEQSLTQFMNEEKIDLIIARFVLFKNYDLDKSEIFKKIFLNVSTLPILLIPENHSFKSFRKLAYFITFTQNDYSNIDWLMNNFPKSKIEVIHTSNNDDTIEQQRWVKYLRTELNDKFTYIRKNEKISDFIKKESDSLNPEYDCLGFTTHKRSFWQNIIDPSTTLNLISKLESPSIIFKYI